MGRECAASLTRFDSKDDRIARQRSVRPNILETRPDAKEYAIIAVRPMHVCIPQLVARD